MQIERADQVEESQDIYTSTNQADMAPKSAIICQYRDIREVNHILEQSQKILNYYIIGEYFPKVGKEIRHCYHKPQKEV